MFDTNLFMTISSSQPHLSSSTRDENNLTVSPLSSRLFITMIIPKFTFQQIQQNLPVNSSLFTLPLSYPFTTIPRQLSFPSPKTWNSVTLLNLCKNSLCNNPHACKSTHCCHYCHPRTRTCLFEIKTNVCINAQFIYPASPFTLQHQSLRSHCWVAPCRFAIIASHLDTIKLIVK